MFLPHKPQLWWPQLSSSTPPLVVEAERAFAPIERSATPFLETDRSDPYAPICEELSSTLSIRSWCPFCLWKSHYFRAFCDLGGAVIGGGLRSMGCPFISMWMLLALAVNRGSATSNYGLLSQGAGFLSPLLRFFSPGILLFFEASELSV